MEENTQENEVTKTEAVTQVAVENNIPVIDVKIAEEAKQIVQEVIEHNHEHETEESPISKLMKMEFRRISEKEKRRRRLANKRARVQRTIQRKRAKGK